jgi:hypothetical protein
MSTKSRIEFTKKLIAMEKQKLDELIKQHQEECPHEYLEIKSEYHRGGYDFWAYSIHTFTCRECGLVVRQEEEEHKGIRG